MNGIALGISIGKLRKLYTACPFKPVDQSIQPLLHEGGFLCVRIENTQFSIAEQFGGIQVGGKVYCYAVCTGGEKLILRSDFAKWVHEQLKAERQRAKNAAEANQMTMGF